jgi:peptidoglycan hydrolase-like protein with peptidoglycan-binding domain
MTEQLPPATKRSLRDRDINVGPAATAAVVLGAIAVFRRSRRAALAAAGAVALEFFPPYRKALRGFANRMVARAEARAGQERSAMSPDPIQPWPVVKRGKKVFPVRPLQQLLRARDHPVVVDGDFGPQTESAVKAFQQSRGLTVDGIVGPQTWPRLIVQVQQGSTGDAVRGVQEVIEFHDQSDGEGPPVHVDGIFGPRTDAWIRGFQTAVGIVSDGIVGPITWRALVSGMLSG